jgi:hypothetical protein
MACKQYETGKETGFDTELTDFVVTDLRDKGLVRFAEQSQGNVPDFDLKVSITEKGIEEIKSALQKPHSPTRYFPVQALRFAGQEISMPSDFPVSSEGFKTILDNTLIENIESLIIKKIMTNIEHFNLQTEDRKELLAEIQTIEVQLSSPKPKAKIIGYAIASAKSLLEKEKKMSAPAFIIIHNIISILHTITTNYKDKDAY